MMSDYLHSNPGSIIFLLNAKEIGKKMAQSPITQPIYLQDDFVLYILAASLFIFVFVTLRWLKFRTTPTDVSTSSAMIQSIGTHVPSHIATADYFLKVVSYHYHIGVHDIVL